MRTVVFITYDEAHVLVAFRAYDPEPEKIRARYRIATDPGRRLGRIVFDTFNDERRGYEFWVNPLGVQTDGILYRGAERGRYEL